MSWLLLTLLHKDLKRGCQFARKIPKENSNSGASNQDNSAAVNSRPHQDVPPGNGQQSPVASNGLCASRAQGLLNVVPVNILGNGQCISTYAFLDNGCTDTFIH